jgi:hypothetical protein
MDIAVTDPPRSPSAAHQALRCRSQNVRLFNFFADGREVVLLRGEEESDDVRRLAVVLGFSDELVRKMKAAR